MTEIDDATLMHAVSSRFDSVTARLITIARALSSQSLRWVLILMIFALTVYAMRHPDPWRCGAAGVFAAIMCPLIWRRDT